MTLWWLCRYRETYATLTEVQLDMKKLKAALGFVLHSHQPIHDLPVATA